MAVSYQLQHIEKMADIVESSRKKFLLVAKSKLVMAAHVDSLMVLGKL